MYFPYFRGKQFELLALREFSSRDSAVPAGSFQPIVEPVRENLNTLQKTLLELSKNGQRCHVVLNPRLGQLSGQALKLSDLAPEDITEEDQDLVKRFIVPAVLVTADHRAEQWLPIASRIEGDDITLIHDGTARLDEEVQVLSRFDKITHVFVGTGLDVYALRCKQLRQEKNDDFVRVLDGFRSADRNSEYPEDDFFSENHLTYVYQDYQGFGDFLTIGDSYSETGGPARAVAIHLTYIDKKDLNRMRCRHFVSDTNDSPDDPGNKFLEADKKLVTAVKQPRTSVELTPAVGEFKRLFHQQHFPGLGYVKKLSMLHHLYTMEHFLGDNPCKENSK
ncbi:sce7725 family protein [Corynebacterium glucuronolyticum]|uniref:Sce7725 family protein n=1 Tax=Corynebacterium glucuronolyticum TaxID=39791 RepID=A0A7T4EHG6_9CORY|nr:sce7725 family protein [Corynebacterium glucuronolyticum]QQB47397.1 sce7725 family protein [Corynebacterium glucuronolyticum]WKD64269.1 hypothetical protein CGLUCO_10155 [Corynebacterium glucuronolyticum DSM 44120]SMB78268.1 hypothetical protein SAMN05660745_01885 [Corynebacterium glucuronolyticum]